MLVSRSSTGPNTANAESTGTTMTPDGRWVLFGSTATNLVAGQSDSASTSDVFLFDRTSAAIVLVSRLAGTVATAANGNSVPRAISASGRYIVFQSVATDLVAGVTDTNAAGDVYLFDRQTGMNRLISHTASSLLQTGNGSSVAFSDVAIDQDGAFVLFQSHATDLLAGVSDTNALEDIYLFDIQTGARTLVSRSASNPNATGTNQSLPTGITPGATHVLYISSASDLVSGVTDSNGTFDAFLFDRAAGTNSLITSAAGQPSQAANGQMNQVVMTPDARWFVVNTRATNMVPGQVDAAFTDDVFLIDRQTGDRRLLSGVNGSLTQAMGAVQTITRQQLSGNGRFVVISTQGTTLVSGVTDTNGVNDLYLFDRDAGSTRLISGANGSTQTTANGLSGSARLSADGGKLMFSSAATNLVAGLTDSNGAAIDAFLLDIGSGLLTTISTAAGNPGSTANAVTTGVYTNSDGSTFLLNSSATNLVPGITDANAVNDVMTAGRPTALFSNGFEGD